MKEVNGHELIPWGKPWFIESLLDYRGNITFFDQEKIPTKKEIIDILTVVHERMPHNNMKWHYKLKVLGPDDEEIKRKLTIGSVCLENGRGAVKKFDTPEKWKPIEEAYDKWRAYQLDETRWKQNKHHVCEDGTIIPFPHQGSDNPDIKGFNEQLRAPWVILYQKGKNNLYPSIKKKTLKLYERGGWDSKVKSGEIDMNMAAIQMGQHSTLTSLLALEAGFDVSYCKCLFQPGLKQLQIDETDFALSIGYPTLPRRSHSLSSILPPCEGYKYSGRLGRYRPKINEIIEW